MVFLALQRGQKVSNLVLALEVLGTAREHCLQPHTMCLIGPANYTTSHNIRGAGSARDRPKPSSILLTRLDANRVSTSLAGRLVLLVLRTEDSLSRATGCPYEAGEYPTKNGLLARFVRPRVMAKTDSFFIRHAVNIDNNNSYQQSTIDLGAYVDALGKSVLRIHNIAVSYSDAAGRTPDMTSGGIGSADFQLCTQTQTDMVVPGDNKSVVASGRLTADRRSGAGVPSSTSNDLDVAPQHWTQGYLIAVEQLYLGGAATSGFAEDVVVSVVMECTSESLSKEAALALALSQQ